MILFLSILLFTINPQQAIKSSTIASGGSTVQSNGKYYSHVVGQQSVSGTATKNGVTMRQGFKQPNFLVRSIQKSGLKVNLEEKNPIEYTVFPNPFKDKLTIKLSELSVSETYIVIYDRAGNVFFEKKYDAGINEIYMDKFEKFKPGVYVLNIVYKGKPFSANIIKDIE
ncbi:MAG: hypothetical protein RJA76_1237 [Bacteroidota bacterium]|jgi:hypothetical protein